MAESVCALARACLVVGLLVGCRARPPENDEAPLGAELLVVAPHPDDEVLMAGALIGEVRARGGRVVVALVTNGDASRRTRAGVRGRESLEALERLGVPRSDVLFLGYPDGALHLLGEQPLSSRARPGAGAGIAVPSATYVDGMENATTVSRTRTGTESSYSAASVRDDLAWVVDTYRPRRIVTAHPADDHPDHAATGIFVTRALEAARGPIPMVSWSIVHAGECWPTPEGPGCLMGRAKPGVPLEPLPGALSSYLPDERVLWSRAPGASAAEVLRAYASQLVPDPETNWLLAFARFDEPLYRSTFACGDVRGGRRCLDARFPLDEPIAARAAGQRWGAGEPVAVPLGGGLRIHDAAGRARRFCHWSEPEGRATVGVETFDRGAVVPGQADLYRRVDFAALGSVRVAWAKERGDVLAIDVRNDRGLLARRLAVLAPPLRVEPDESCSSVP